VFATTGDASNLAIVAAMLMPWLAWRASAGSRLAVAAAGSAGFALAASLSRGGWVAFGAGLAAWLALEWARAHRPAVAASGPADEGSAAESRTAHRMLVAGVWAWAASAAGAAAALLAALALRADVARLATGGATDTISGRLAVWQATVPMITARPVLGWGPGAFARAFPRFATTATVDAQARGELLADPHNALLSATASSGIVGGVLLAAVAVVIAVAAWRAADREQGRLVAAAAGSLAALAAGAMFHFVTLETGAMAAVALGLVLAVAPAAAGAPAEPEPALNRGAAADPTRIAPLAWASLAALFALAAAAGVGLVVADTAWRTPPRDLAGARRAAATARMWAGWEPFYEVARVRGTLPFIDARTGGPDALAFALADRARVDADPRGPLARADAELAAVLGGVGGAEAARTTDAYRAVLAEQPLEPRAWAGLGVALAAAGDIAGSIEALQRATALAPRYERAWVALAGAYAAAGKSDEAAAARARAEALARTR
jgi:tetratricopeptide (TPR) repeat protein